MHRYIHIRTHHTYTYAQNTHIMHTYIHTYMHACIHAYICAYIRVFVFIFVHSILNVTHETYVCIPTFMYIYVYIYMYVCICTQLYAHTHSVLYDMPYIVYYKPIMHCTTVTKRSEFSSSAEERDKPQINLQQPPRRLTTAPPTNTNPRQSFDRPAPPATMFDL